jgi:hypothetical protein
MSASAAGWQAAGGAAVLLAGALLLATDLPAWNTLWYLFAWYGWLLVLDAWLARHGRSWLRGRRRELLLAMAWSIPFWYLFEAYNLRLANWYYVFVLRSDLLQLAVSLLAFATVIPACLLHADLVAAWWPAAGVRLPPWRLTRSRWWALAGLAAICALAPLLSPRLAFALVWFAPLLPAELACRRLGVPSPLGDLERGRPARMLHLLAGGLLAGGVWEGLNFWARCKWIYTVPFFERLKLFEMPLLGFLGFPVLALSAAAVWSLLRAFVPAEWRADPAAVVEGRSHAAPAPLPSRTAVAVTLLAVVAGAAVYPLVVRCTVESRRPLLAELPSLTAADGRALSEAGLSTPERLERAVAREGIAAVARRSGVTPASLAPAWRHAELALHKGMGAHSAGQLLAAGVTDVGALGVEDAAALHARLRRLALAAGDSPPRRAVVEVWVQAARGRTRPRR